MVLANGKWASLAATWLCVATVTEAQVMVTASSGPSSSRFREGMFLPPNGALTLLAGDRLEVLDAAGSHVLVGPRTLSINQIDRPANEKIRLITAQGHRSDVAAVRGFVLQGPSPEALWDIRTAPGPESAFQESHDFCLPAGVWPVLWRDAKWSTGRLVISTPGTNQSREIAWPAGEQHLPWPEDLRATEGAAYDLSLDGGQSVSLRFRTLSAIGDGLTELAGALEDAACYDQLERVEAALPRP